MPIKNPSDIRLNEQSEIEAIIGNPPGWTLRWGMSVLFILTAILLIISWFVRYPDIVEARAVLTTENPPIRLVAGASAKISDLKVMNGQMVKAGDIMAVLENTAELKDIIILEKWLADFNKNPSDWATIKLPKNLQLGDLQTSFSLFSQHLSDLQYLLSKDINQLKINNLSSQIRTTSALNNALKKQAAILSEELDLVTKRLDKEKNSPGVTAYELEQTQTRWIGLRRLLETLYTDTLQNNLKTAQLRSQILDLQQLQMDGQQNQLSQIRTDSDQLNSDIKDWKQTWLIISPIHGEIVLTKAWSNNQFVKEGEEVLTIVPKESAGKLLAKALLKGESAGKVAEGMAAHIRLDGYPYQEYGVLKGNIGTIAAVPNEAGYEIEITLTDSLTTSYGKNLPFLQEMQGTARIVTEDRSLLHRILGKIAVAIKQ